VRAGAADGLGAQAGRAMRPYVATRARCSRTRWPRQGGALRGGAGHAAGHRSRHLPVLTSSNTVAGNAAVGAGLGPTAIHSVIGITKRTPRAWATVRCPPSSTTPRREAARVGAEYGATTGRPRRCGWLDALVLRYDGAGERALRAGDDQARRAHGFEKILVATATSCPTARRVGEFPSDPELLRAGQAHLRELPGWKEPLGDQREYQELPENTRRYIERVEQLVGWRPRVSLGAERAQTIVRRIRFGTPEAAGESRRRHP